MTYEKNTTASHPQPAELAEQPRGGPIDVTDPWRGLYQAERLSAPSEYGDITHPDVPRWPDDREDALDKLVHAQGFDFQIVAGEFTEAAMDDGDELYWQEMRAWNPEAPEGEWRLAWKGDTEDGPYAWFVRPMALRPETAAPPAQGIEGYQGAFYELAGMLGMTAQPCSPKEVWETQMRPALQALTTPDPTLLRFYQVTDYPSLAEALEAHVLKLIETCKRNVKPWEDTFPPTLLPKWERERFADLIDAASLVNAACIENKGDAAGLHLAVASTGGLNERLTSALACVRGAA